jgi:hypothetical protein
MAVTIADAHAQPSDSLAFIAEPSNDKRDNATAKRALASETTKPEEDVRPRREGFFDFLRRALSVPHV